MKKNNNRTLLVLFTGVLMGALDISIVGPAIPAISKALQVDEKALAWIFSIYVLFNLSGVSLMAKLSDRYGRRKLYILSVLIFAAGSVIVGMSDNYSMLLIGRAVQGFGSSGIFPVASAVVGDVFPPEKRGRALGLIGSVFGIAFIIGPFIAGLLLRYFTWHYLFFLNIPISLLVIYGSYRQLNDETAPTTAPFDWKGVVFLSGLLTFFALALYSIDPVAIRQTLFQSAFLPFLAGSVIFTVLFVYAEKRAKEPVVQLSFFSNRQLLVVGLIAVGSGVFEASFVFMPKIAVLAFNVSTSAASFMMGPTVLASAIGAPLWGRLLDKTGSKAVIFISLVLSVIGVLLISRETQVRYMFYTGTALFGLGLSALVGSSLRYIVLNEVAASERAVSQGMITIFTSTGQITGSVIIGIIAVTAGGLQGYQNAFLFLAALTSLLVLLSLLLKGRKKELAFQENAA
jgi:multidrug resistance protein